MTRDMAIDALTTAYWAYRLTPQHPAPSALVVGSTVFEAYAPADPLFELTEAQCSRHAVFHGVLVRDSGVPDVSVQAIP